jgi:hypothetical protein
VGEREARCPVDEDAAERVKAGLDWLLDKRGPYAPGRPMLVPGPDFYRSMPGWTGTGTAGDVRAVFELVRERMEVPATSLELDVFELDARTRRSGIRRAGLRGEGHLEQSGMYVVGRTPPQVRIARHMARDPVRLVALTAHEVAHHVTIADDPGLDQQAAGEVLADLAAVFFGFGVFQANSRIRWTFDLRVGGLVMLKRNYLTLGETAYALAVLASLRGERSPEWARSLSRGARRALEQAQRCLAHGAPRWAV